MRSNAVALAVLLAACKFPYPADVPDDDAGSTDAAIDARTCTPNVTTCTNGKLTSCDATGHLISYVVPNGGADGAPITVTLDDYPCPLGCAAAGTRCADVAPSNGLGPALDAATLSSQDVVVDDTSADAALSTTMDLQNGFAFIYQGAGSGQQLAVPARIVTQADGPDVLVLEVRSFTLRPGVRLRVAGTRAFAIASRLDVYIGGTLDASGAVWGPGTSTLAGCSIVGQAGALGGGGNQDDGGASSTGGAGGSNLRAHSPTLTPLEGGCSSERVPAMTGGGAVQLVSPTRIALGPAAVISVAGRQGTGRLNNGQLLLTGGGSGGAVLLEAPAITFSAGSRIVGRGGSGAAGSTVNNSFQNGVAGDADLAATSVPGATCAACGVGGNGGTQSAAPTSGQGTGTSLGSGGGSIGRCRLATRSGVVFPPPGTMLISTQQGPIGIR